MPTRSILAICLTLVCTTLIIILTQWIEDTGSTEQATTESERVPSANQSTQPNSGKTILPIVETVRHPKSGLSIMRPTQELVKNPPTIRSDVPNLDLYSYEREAFLASREGEKLTITLPDPVNETEMWVDKATKNPSGSITLTGKINGYSDYSFVMTLGPKSTYATIGTREGVFNLRGDTRYLWVGLGRSFNHHVNPETPDYRVNN